MHLYTDTQTHTHAYMYMYITDRHNITSDNTQQSPLSEISFMSLSNIVEKDNRLDL